jgi:hypothetical protein
VHAWRRRFEKEGMAGLDVLEAHLDGRELDRPV